MKVTVQVIIESDEGGKLVEDVVSLTRGALLLPERTAPELAYLEAQWASLISYGLTVDLLTEVLPLAGHVNTTGVRRQLQHVAERAERALGDEQYMFVDGCPLDWGRLPRPDSPITVGIDGG